MPEKLTRREREVAMLVAEGLTSKEIAQKLFISERTAEGHVDEIRSKLGFRTRAQIAGWVAAKAVSPASATPLSTVAGDPTATSSRQRVRPASASRWIWLTSGSMLMVALGILTVTVFIPALLTVPASGPRIETFAGTGIPGISVDNDPARSTNIIGPNGVAVSATGDVYFTDGNRLRMVSRGGRVQTIAGTETAGFAGDNGPAIEAKLSITFEQSAEVAGIVVDSKGDVYFSDTLNDRVREITPDGRIMTIAGSGQPGHSSISPPPANVGDGGQGVDAVLSQPRGLAIDSLGDLFIADTNDNRVRKLNPAGIISTVAGTGALGWSGDKGPAQLAELSAPEGVALDVQGELFIADSGNERIRKISGGMITTVAGNGSSGYSGDGGPATKAELALPLGLAVDSRGNLYVADSANERIRKVDLAGVITTVAGNGQAGYSGDSRPALSATLNLPVALAVDALGDMYIADSANNRLRVVRLGSE